MRLAACPGLPYLSGLKSAEAEALEHLPDTDVKQALQELPEDFRIAVYLVDVEGLQGGRWIMDLNRHRDVPLHRSVNCSLLEEYALERGFLSVAERVRGRGEWWEGPAMAGTVRHSVQRGARQVYAYLDSGSKANCAESGGIWTSTPPACASTAWRRR